MLYVFEGIDGSGKTTHVGIAAKYLRKMGKRVKIFKYPDREGEYAKVLSDFLDEKVQLSPESQFLTFLADIAKDQEKIADALSRGYYVLVDRYIFSTIAYQHLPLDRACAIVSDLHFIHPRAVFYFDVTPDVAMERMRGKRRYTRFERDEEHLTLARIRYRTLADRNFLSQWKIFNTTQPIAQTAEEIKRQFTK